MAFPAEQLIGQEVEFLRRPGREDGLPTYGIVTGVDDIGRLLVRVDDGSRRVWTIGQVRVVG